MNDTEYLRQAEIWTARDQQYSNFRELYVKYRENGVGVRESVDLVLVEIYGKPVDLTGELPPTDGMDTI